MPVLALDFDRPGFLFLLPVVLVLLFVAERGSLTSWTSLQRVSCRILRGSIASLLVLALAGPRMIQSSDEVAVVFLRDVSASLPPGLSATALAELRPFPPDGKARSAELGFAASPVIVRPFSEASPVSAPLVPEEDATDLAAALEFAAAILPPDRPGRLVVLSDGITTSGRDPLESAAALAARGVEIDTIRLQAPEVPETALVGLDAPAQVRSGEVFDLSARLHSNVAVDSATLRLYQNQILIAETETTLKPGYSEVIFPRVKATDRSSLYEVELLSSTDTRAENNRRRKVMIHGGPARVLIIDREPDQSKPLAQALRGSGFEVEIRPPAGLPTKMEGLEAFDLVVFSAAPADAFPDASLTGLADWVRNFGGGFLMLGGGDSFGAGGYFRTPIEALLPVSMESQEREEMPVVALLVILDRSGSMSATVGSQTKMSLASEGAALALDVLQSKDLFGLFAVDTRIQEVIPLGRVADRKEADRRIAGISSGGGGIYIYTSLAEALPRMRDAQARIKHIILFSDASDAEEKSPIGANPSGAHPSSFDLANALLANKITVSVVALGSDGDRDTAFLRQLAAQGGGRFYLTPDATALPRLFTLETMRAMESSLIEEPFAAVPVADPALLTGIDWATAPLLLGANITEEKPGAEVLLRSENGDPLLAIWRYGLGQVAAFSSDAKARWATEWISWPGYTKFWSQLARALVGDGRRPDFALTVREEQDQLVIEADASTPEGEFRNGLDVKVSLAIPGQPPQTLSAPQVAPGLYRSSLPLPKADSAMIAVSEAENPPVAGTWTQNYPAEFQVTDKDSRILEQLSALTSGMTNPTDVFRPAHQPARSRRDLAPYLLFLAVLLWPVDIWLRRRDWKGTEPGQA